MPKASKTNTFTLLYFASAASITKVSSEDFSAQMSVSELYQKLEEQYPGIKNKILCSSALTINMDYIDLAEADEILLKQGDEVAIIPPVSSG